MTIHWMSGNTTHPNDKSDCCGEDVKEDRKYFVFRCLKCGEICRSITKQPKIEDSELLVGDSK